MKYFHSNSGNNHPSFRYRLKVDKVTPVMFDWATEYPPEDAPFKRWHVEWDHQNTKGFELIQFESEDAYFAFKYAFAGEILEDRSW